MNEEIDVWSLAVRRYDDARHRCNIAALLHQSESSAIFFEAARLECDLALRDLSRARDVILALS